MKMKDLKCAFDAISKGFEVEMVCGNGVVERITAGKTPLRSEPATLDFLSI